LIQKTGDGSQQAFALALRLGQEDGGVRVCDVRAGSPAEGAGVRAGDVIVAFAGMTVGTLQDFSFALRSRRPGDRVDVTVRRDGAEHRFQAVLGERR